jgi:predicted acylesterase/phospholipase RssA
MTIQHLVISGGGPTGILSYGVISTLAKKDFWQLTDIKSMYGTSIGAYVCFMVSLGYEWEWLDDYFIKRPWEKLVAASTNKLTDIYEKKSILNGNFYTEAIKPLLRGKDISETITLAEFYAYNKIDFHLYAANINAKIVEKVDISHQSHPNLSLIHALRMSMAVPVMFDPIFIEGGCFIDGGLMNNFPLNDCIEQQKCDFDHILGIKNVWKENVNQSINEKSSIFDFVLEIIKKMRAYIDLDENHPAIKNIVYCVTDEFATADKWVETLSSEKLRKRLVEIGCSQADLFLTDLCKSETCQSESETCQSESGTCQSETCQSEICQDEKCL